MYICASLGSHPSATHLLPLIQAYSRQQGIEPQRWLVRSVAAVRGMVEHCSQIKKKKPLE
jgi:hypothetical protein